MGLNSDKGLDVILQRIGPTRGMGPHVWPLALPGVTGGNTAERSLQGIL